MDVIPSAAKDPLSNRDTPQLSISRSRWPPFYHFEYDGAGNVAFASFASDLRRYDVSYAAGRLQAMQNNVLVNKDRLTYLYDGAGASAK